MCVDFSYIDIVFFCICVEFLYSAQFLLVLQDLKRYLTHPDCISTAQALKRPISPN